jgi:L-ascorbate metabolism protein UlaG (beta-lactamase superfamily)
MKGTAFLLLPALALLQGCFFVAITRSAERDLRPQSIRLSQSVTVTSLGAVDINGAAFFPSGFRIDTPDRIIYIDPIMIDDPKPADLILVTHAHPDHLSLPYIQQIATSDTIIVGPASVARELSGCAVRKVAPGDNLSVDGIQCEAVAAYNTNRVFLWIAAHPKSARNVGYVLTNGDLRIYHAGDSDLIPEMRRLTDITVAMVPIGGDNLTMDPAQGAATINAIRPGIAIPMHYSIARGDQLESFRSLVEAGISVSVFPDQGH